MPPTFKGALRAFGLSIGAAMLLATASTGADAAAVTYHYTGKHFNSGISGCLTAAMHISLSVTLPAALPANLKNQITKPVSWVVNDGLHVFRGTAATSKLPLAAILSTDATGKINQWNVLVSVPAASGFRFVVSTTPLQDSATDNSCTPPGKAQTSFKPGVWTLL